MLSKDVVLFVCLQCVTLKVVTDFMDRKLLIRDVSHNYQRLSLSRKTQMDTARFVLLRISQ